ncbi:MAG: hypothetical protein ABSH49_24920 [Bryobacteraceae bacterium]
MAKVVQLYRSTRDLQHWFVRIPGTGWVRFPAKVNGWAEHRMVTMFSQQHLNQAPLWLAFNTGLLEGIEKRGLDRAA